MLKICLDIKSFKCRGCNQHPEIWNWARQCSAQCPGKKSAWLRGACRGQVVSALSCSKLSSSYNICNKSTLSIRNLLWGRFYYLLKQTGLVCTCSQLPFNRQQPWEVGQVWNHRIPSVIPLAMKTVFVCTGIFFLEVIWVWIQISSITLELDCNMKRVSQWFWAQNTWKANLWKVNFCKYQSRPDFRVVRHLAARWGACQSCEMHLLGSATGSAGKVVEGQSYLARLNQASVFLLKVQMI